MSNIKIMFESKNYTVELAGEITKKIDRIEENTDNYLEEYFDDIYFVVDAEREMSRAVRYNIEINADIPDNVIMDKVTKCINNFIRENDNK